MRNGTVVREVEVDRDRRWQVVEVALRDGEIGSGLDEETAGTAGAKRRDIEMVHPSAASHPIDAVGTQTAAREDDMNGVDDRRGPRGCANCAKRVSREVDVGVVAEKGQVAARVGLEHVPPVPARNTRTVTEVGRVCRRCAGEQKGRGCAGGGYNTYPHLEDSFAFMPTWRRWGAAGCGSASPRRRPRVEPSCTPHRECAA